AGAALAVAETMGTAISAANARAAISTFMTRPIFGPLWSFGISAWADRPAPAGPKMPTPVPPCRDGNHTFRMIQNDSLSRQRAQCLCVRPQLRLAAGYR